MHKESTAKTIGVAFVVCVVCSVLVSVTAVSLRGIQEANKAFDKQKNILVAAGLVAGDERPSKAEADEKFQQIQSLVINTKTGDLVPDKDANAIDWLKAAKEGETIPSSQDTAKIVRMSQEQPVYLLWKDDKIDRVVLPVYGKGLWSTMYGFLALEGDFDTIGALTFYSHGETPGLGGEIDNPQWKAKWVGKLAFEDGKPAIRVIKGAVKADSPQAPYEVDGLSGATLTCDGVTSTVQFWLGKDGYGEFLKKLKEPAFVDELRMAREAKPEAS